VLEKGSSAPLSHLSRTHRVNVSWAGEILGGSDTQIHYIDTRKQAADVLTKAFTDKFKWGDLLGLIGMHHDMRHFRPSSRSAPSPCEVSNQCHRRSALKQRATAPCAVALPCTPSPANMASSSDSAIGRLGRQPPTSQNETSWVQAFRGLTSAACDLFGTVEAGASARGCLGAYEPLRRMALSALRASGRFPMTRATLESLDAANLKKLGRQLPTALSVDAPLDVTIVGDSTLNFHGAPRRRHNENAIVEYLEASLPQGSVVRGGAIGGAKAKEIYEELRKCLAQANSMRGGSVFPNAKMRIAIVVWNMNDLSGGKTKRSKIRRVREVTPDMIAEAHQMHGLLAQFDEAIVIGPGNHRLWGFPEEYDAQATQLMTACLPPKSLHLNGRHIFEALEKYDEWHFRWTDENRRIFGKAVRNAITMEDCSRVIR